MPRKKGDKDLPIYKVVEINPSIVDNKHLENVLNKYGKQRFYYQSTILTKYLVFQKN